MEPPRTKACESHMACVRPVAPLQAPVLAPVIVQLMYELPEPGLMPAVRTTMTLPELGTVTVAVIAAVAPLPVNTVTYVATFVVP